MGMAKNYLHVHRLRRVYVWELPVRFYHWLNALVIIVVIVQPVFRSAVRLALIEQR